MLIRDMMQGCIPVPPHGVSKYPDCADNVPGPFIAYLMGICTRVFDGIGLRPRRGQIPS